MTEPITPIRPALSQCDLPVAASVLVGVWCLTGAATCLGLGALLDSFQQLGLRFVHAGPLPEIAVALAVFGAWWVCHWNRSLSVEDDLRTLGNWICGLTLAALLARLLLGKYAPQGSLLFDRQSGLPLPPVLWVAFLLALPALAHDLSHLARAIQRDDLARFARRIQWLLPAVVVAGTGVSCLTHNGILGGTLSNLALPLPSPLSQVIVAALALGLLWRLAPAVWSVVSLAAARHEEPSPAIADGLTYEPPRSTLRRQPLAIQIATRGARGIFACAVAATVALIIDLVVYWVHGPMRPRDDSFAVTLWYGTSLVSLIVFSGAPVLSVLLAAWQKQAGKSPWRSTLTRLICLSVGIWLLLSCTLPHATRSRPDDTVLAWLGARWFIAGTVAHDFSWLLICLHVLFIGRALGREVIVILATASIGCLLTSRAMNLFPSWFPGRGLTSGYAWFVVVSSGVGLVVQCFLWFFVAKGLDSLAQVPEQEQARPAEPVAV